MNRRLRQLTQLSTSSRRHPRPGALAYFARQRDRFQQRSDDLLHNILPDEIADRLKDEHTLIADDFTSASVLSPMSSASPRCPLECHRPSWWAC